MMKKKFLIFGLILLVCTILILSFLQEKKKERAIKDIERSIIPNEDIKIRALALNPAEKETIKKRGKLALIML